ncbi:MAG: 30S ribosomal protein S4 [Chloroflexi bacterium]|jgi:small subunit ribosomal protein S4|nr:30S ribosomal protein S4 [Chloroflexota bacterium]
MKYTGPKVKLSRRLGIPLTPKAAQVMERHPYPPGQHGQAQGARASRMSNYKQQLLEKQRLKAQYNIHERQMRNYFERASSKKGNTIDNLIQMLETRLDAVVLRSGLAPTIYAARQLVNHGHIQVNGRRVNVPGYTVAIGDTVSVKEKSRNLPVIEEALDAAAPPQYLNVNPEERTVQLGYLPRREEVPVICDMIQVIEFYSR